MSFRAKAKADAAGASAAAAAPAFVIGTYKHSNAARSLSETYRIARIDGYVLPRNSAANRIRNRCEVTGRPRAFYRKLKMSRIALRELGNLGQIPGLTKSSW
jgi:small subunit ribosomal protein S14